MITASPTAVTEGGLIRISSGWLYTMDVNNRITMMVIGKDFIDIHPMPRLAHIREPRQP
jgi:hypothetical protein